MRYGIKLRSTELWRFGGHGCQMIVRPCKDKLAQEGALYMHGGKKNKKECLCFIFFFSRGGRMDGRKASLKQATRQTKG